ncbi:hypothetical protein [Amycolatopsis albispora]|uniref:DUF3558 domain-containing protein n=1 Tax=Amycolatopsis albispora TaxID=1804986 RepID=A0A344L4J9_9PSEU|nr:hypothetical protein A4R43_10795 [Amycolatopsis albispora]
MQVAALAATAVAFAGLAGCADRPNDLDTYYDDPVPSSAPAMPPAPPPAPAAAPPAQQRAATAPALLTDADVAAEEVRQAAKPATPSKCLAPLVDQVPEDQRERADWQYRSGASLSHQVLLTRGAAEAVTRLICSGATPVQLTPTGAEAQRAWCETDKGAAVCTVLLARGDVISAVQVAASTQARATDAAKRLAPISAAALVRVSS